MKAAAFTKPGPPDVLELHSLPDPEAGPGEVRVRVKAAGVQPYDTAVRAGWEPGGVKLTWPRVPGNEFAGVVDQLGDDVAGIAVGTEVLGFTAVQAYAELVVVPAHYVTPKPPEMPWEVAGGFTAGAQTAHIALQELRVGAGDVLVVHGAAGAVGTVAVQLGGLWGATVIGTGSEANQDYLRSLGAIPVVYTGLDAFALAERIRAAAPSKITTALDGAGGTALAASLELVANRDRILTLAEHERAGELGIRVTPFARSAERLAELAALYAEGKLSFHVRRTLPLASAAEAHREMETGHGRGKLVLTVP